MPPFKILPITPATPPPPPTPPLSCKRFLQAVASAQNMEIISSMIIRTPTDPHRLQFQMIHYWWNNIDHHRHLFRLNMLTINVFNDRSGDDSSALRLRFVAGLCSLAGYASHDSASPRSSSDTKQVLLKPHFCA